LRNSTIQRYLARILIYTIVYVIFLIIMDTLFNGTVLDFLFNNLPKRWFNIINQNRTITALLVYILGLVIISMIYVFKLSRLLTVAGRSFSEEEPKIFGESCPPELRDFSQKLKEFKYDLKANEQARKVAEQQKNDLVVYLAHDLKTPLTSVIGYLSLLEEAEDMPTELRAKYTGIALDKAYRLEQLINEFFEITRLNLQTIPAHKSPVNLTILLIQVINEFFPMLEEKGLCVTQNIQPELIVSADADKLARVFDNLFRNAVNYSHRNTELVCNAHKNGDFVLISIQNQGDHIPQEKLNRLFDKFYRLDSARQSATGGAGLGLTIAKQIVESHDGAITASCRDGITEFKIVLPM